MRKVIIVLVAGFAIAAAAPAEAPPPAESVERGSIVTQSVPDIPDQVIDRIRQYQNIRSATFQGWDPSGGMLIATRFAETSQIHRVAAPGGAREQLTFFDEPVAGASCSPDPAVNGFLFTKDVGGGEFYQVFHFDRASGSHTMLTDGSSRNGSPVWANDGRRFAWYTTKRNGKDWDIHIGDIRDPGRSRPLIEKEGSWVPADWSPDDRTLIVTRTVSANESHPYLADVSSGRLTPFGSGEEPVAYGPLRFSRDGKGIWFTSDEGSEFRSLRYRDLTSGATTVLTGDTAWDVTGFALSRDGRLIAWAVNEDGVARLRLRDLASGRDLPVPDLPPGLVGGMEFSPQGDRLGMTLNTSQTPGDAYALDLASGRLERWTRSEVGGLDADRFVAPRLIRYETFDAVDGKPRMIPAFVYEPRGAGPFPVIVSIHGGPEGQSRPSFSSLIQYWVNELGIAVIAPNVRGSTGYGKSWLKLDNGFAREDSVKDIGRLLDWIASRPDLDRDRVAVYGGSYGGYMALACMAHFGDRLRAGIDVVGISNFLTFLNNTMDYRRDLRRVEYGDERDPGMRSFLDRISPLNNAAKITRPLYVAQGQNDPRVPVGESEQMVREIRARGGTVWYVLAKDEGHGFRKKRNSDYHQAAMSLFLERFLLDGRAPAR